MRGGSHAASVTMSRSAAWSACRKPETSRAPGRAAAGGYACVLAAGPTGLGRAVAEACAAAGVASQIALEAPMACGIGGCYGCAVELDDAWHRLCVEGPVVDGGRLVA